MEKQLLPRSSPRRLLREMIAICVGCYESSPANDRMCRTFGNTCKISAIPTSKARFSHTCFLSAWNYGVRMYATLATSTVGVLLPDVDRLWGAWWSLNTFGRAIAAVQYISCLIYPENENPVFAPRTPNGGGGPT